MFAKRAITSLIFVPFLIWTIFYAHPLFFFILINGVIIIGLFEFYSLVKKAAEVQPSFILGIILSLFISFYAYKFELNDLSLGLVSAKFMAIIIFLIPLLFLTKFFCKDFKKAVPEIALTFFGILYIGWMLFHLVLIKEVPYGNKFLFLVFVITWMTDIGAYLIGTKWGTHKLTLYLSPNKTIEGSLAGLAFAICSTFIFKWLFLPSVNLSFALTLALIVSITGQLGDLCESLIKRGAKAKDSGTLIPGHGGVLDVFDSLIFSAPAAFYYLVYFPPEIFP